MQKIRQLPPHEAQKIAAGEVVDRPAHVVKELFENAIDAGARCISIFIEEGGRSLIRIRDDGSGMSPEDARMCIQNHATSKIVSVNDLESINTFGFRGEALASVASVSRLTITTKETGTIAGVRLRVEEGVVVSEEAVACPEGTEIVAQDLFYNVPARQKFLKAKETEWRAIQQLCTAMSLAHPHIDIKLYHDQRLVMNAPSATSMRERSAQILDQRLVKSALFCELTDVSGDQIQISGFVTNAHYVRYDRSQIFLFVNKRWVKNQKLSQALMRGYLNALPSDRFPAAAIFIAIDSREVDVNMHPRKEEVQFLHPRHVEQAVEQAVRKMLEQHTALQIIPAVSMPQSTSSWQPSFSSAMQLPQMPEYSADIPTQAVYERAFNDAPHVAMNKPEVVHQQLSALEHSGPVFKLVGQVHSTYMQIETDEGLVIIDQHAAHERILYEKFLTKFQNITPVALTNPEIIAVLPSDVALMLQHQEIFLAHGMTTERVGELQFSVTHTPSFLRRTDVQELMLKIIGWIHEHKQLDAAQCMKLISEKIRAQMACKAAVKAGDRLSPEEMRQLVIDLYQAPNRFSCPHGRPTSWLISRSDIDRKFRRI